MGTSDQQTPDVLAYLQLMGPPGLEDLLGNALWALRGQGVVVTGTICVAEDSTFYSINTSDPLNTPVDVVFADDKALWLALYEGDIACLRDLRGWSLDNLEELPGFDTDRHAEKVRDALQKFGLSLRD